MAITQTPFDPSDFLSFASSVMANDSPNEAALRSAISRAYYSVFLTARDQLFGRDGVGLSRVIRNQLRKRYKVSRGATGNPGLHQLIILAAKEKSVTTSQQIEQLREAREHADYRTDSVRALEMANKGSWLEYAKENVALASQVLPLVRRLPSY